MNTHAELIEWLRDAYAMQKSMEAALQKLIAHPYTQSALRDQAAQHCRATRQHADALAFCLKQLGADTSSLKTVLAQGMDLRRGAGAAFARDERIKDVLTVFVTEHFEISCHSILRTGAAQLGRWEIVGICDEILFEEKRMAGWLQANLPQIIAAYLAHKETPAASLEDEEDDDLNGDLDEETSGTGLAEYRAHDRVTRWETFHLAQTSLNCA